MPTFILSSSNSDTLTYLEKTLGEVSTATVVGVSPQPDQLTGLLRAQMPDGLLLDIGPDPEALLPMVEDLSGSFPRLSIFLVCQKEYCSQDLLLKIMRLGVREFFPIPFASESDLKTAVDRISRTAPSGNGVGKAIRGKMTCVISSKGGTGSTLIATNLAVSLARHGGKSTALVDLNLQLGDVGLFMDLKPVASIADLAKNIDRLDPILLSEMMTPHESGVQVLAAPRRVEEAGMISQSHLHKAYPLLKSMYERVIVDLPVAIDEPMLATLQNVDEVLLVTLLNIPAIRNTKRYLEIFERLGLPPQRIKLIVNRYSRRSEDSFSIKEAEKALGHPVFATIPNSYATAISAINQGIPLSELSAGSPIARAFDQISDLLNQPAEGANGNGHLQNGNGKKSIGNLFSRIFKPAAEVK